MAHHTTHQPAMQRVAQWAPRPLLPMLMAFTAFTLSIGLSLPLAASAATLTRTSAFSYDATSGLLTKEVIEPDTSSLCLVTEYTYDSYGNKTAATTRNCNGTAPEAAAPTGDPLFTSRSSSNTYDARGQFPTTSTNALSQSETKTFNPNFGTAATLTGPNGLTTAWAYDSFGRKTAEQRADGNGTTWTYQYCNGINGGTTSCPTISGVAGAYVVTSTPVAAPIVITNGALVSTGAVNGAYSKTYYDALNREIRSETQGFDGTASVAIYKDTQYDGLGRPYKTSRPYYSGQTAQWITVAYDGIGRIISETQADNTVTSTSYNGLVVTVTNANSQTRTTTKNSQGQVIQVKDTQNNLLTYSYDPFGNLIQTQDDAGNLTNLTYDLRGRKTAMLDPDMGSWTYVYDALGQLKKQTDAKSQLTTMAYDALGRMTNRSEADLISNWYYDTYKGGGACNKGTGKLCQAETDHGYNKTVNYDSLGRYSSATTTIDTTYTDSVSYDSTGRLLTKVYPTGVATKYVYTALGYLKEVRDNASNALYWQANTLDAEGHLLTQTYGNNVQTIQNYNVANGRITSITAGAGNAVQYFTYQYDNLGNITTRIDGNQGLTETFTYDTLNRLQTAQVNAPTPGIVTTTYAYNDIGNMTSRSDLSPANGYAYPASGASSVRPHALSQVTLSAGGYRTYSYDANGNLASATQYDASNAVVPGNGRVATFTSFNMPSVIYNDATSQVKLELSNYGPEHQRLVSTVTTSAGTDTTIYLNPDNAGGLSYEKETKPDSSIEQRHFITAYGMSIAVIKQTTVGTTTTTTTRYFHRDNLGSTTTVTDESGTIIERLAYEPFGNRRFANGSTDPNNTIVPLTTNRGFTNHEHFDGLDLIHMNGRIYDPITGRFLSADPNIPNPGDLQSYNRYSYALNDPLIYIDPTGYFNLGHALSHAWKSATHSTIGQIAIAVAAYWAAPYLSSYVGWTGNAMVGAAGGAGGLSYSLGLGVGAANGMMGGALAGALIGGDFRSAAIGGATGGAFGYVGDQFPSGIPNVAGHAAVGCASASLSGGGCGSGALSAGFSAAYTNYGPTFDSFTANLVSTTVVGGTASVLGGGNFANGAQTAAFGYLFNCSLHKCWDKYLYNGSKVLLGSAGALGGAATCVGVVSCAMGAPAVAFSLSNVGEGATAIRGLINDTSDGQGNNVLVDTVKGAMASKGASPAVQNSVAIGLQVGADVLGVLAPVRIAEQWLIAPMITTTTGLAIKSNVWNTSSKFTNTANAVLDASGL